jgi:AcrR family transcriptional regulator
MAEVKQGAARSVREERAWVTRGRITEAARRLFRAQGYGATTLTDVAREAGVAVQTIYAIYRSKAGLLRALREGLREHPEADAQFEAAVRERDADRVLGLFARSIRIRWQDGADIVAIHRDAAAVDGAIRTEVDATLAVRRAGLERLARSLKTGLGAVATERASAILDVLTLPEVYLELVEVQGWTPDEFEAWLGQALRGQLIG